jgi:hypothetical protein
MIPLSIVSFAITSQDEKTNKYPTGKVYLAKALTSTNFMLVSAVINTLAQYFINVRLSPNHFK